MKLLLDTHTLLWFTWGHANLSANARTLMMEATNDLFLSAASLWEIAVKVSLNKLLLAQPYQAFLERAIADNSLIILPITVAHGAELTTLPLHHRDPFDRLLIAQALVEGMPLLSNDAAFDAYLVKRLW